MNVCMPDSFTSFCCPLMSTDVFTRFSQLILDLLSFLKMTYPVSAGQGFIHHFMGHWQTVHNQIRYDIM